ncbi:HIRAN domain-containing protein [Pontimonas salivibrio]|uniref:HIRAN domain-containing protein n=1 Tax=Pontimonas salivibrio TaxID=1159327 RepID=A0A2L2BRH7_9MICO|nr:hypothetical protein [Pontimonas salivibrio]AVG24260.1 HIRAN domain-containing protein [Pontimonas salivibrio]
MEVFWFLMFFGGVVASVYFFGSRGLRNRAITTGAESNASILTKLANELPLQKHADFQFRPGEHLVWVQKNVNLIESRQAPRISRRSADAFTVALAKGFFYTAASGTSISPEPGDVLRIIDSGRVTFTNMRVMFIGKHHSREWDMAKLVGWNADNGGQLMMATSNRKRMSGVALADPTNGLAPSVAFDLAGIAQEEGWEAARLESRRGAEAARAQSRIVHENPWASTERLQELIEQAENRRLKAVDDDERAKSLTVESPPQPTISEIEVVGQQFQRSNLEKLRRDFRAGEAFDYIVEAELVQEPENDHSPSGRAVAVLVKGLKVGYVPEWLALRVFQALDSVGGRATLPGSLRLSSEAKDSTEARLTLSIDSRLPINPETA